MDLAALRVDAVEYRLDGTVLAGRIHALQDQQHRPAVLRVKLFLKIAQAFSIGIEDLFRLGLVEAGLLAGLVRLEMELTRPVEAERRDEGPQLIAKILRRLLAHDVGAPIGSRKFHGIGRRRAAPELAVIRGHAATRGPQMSSCTSGNLEIPGSLALLRPGMTLLSCELRFDKRRHKPRHRGGWIAWIR